MSLIQKVSVELTYGQNSERRFVSILPITRIFLRHETVSWRLRHVKRSIANEQIPPQMIGNVHSLALARIKARELQRESMRTKSDATTDRWRTAIALLPPTDMGFDVSIVEEMVTYQLNAAVLAAEQRSRITSKTIIQSQIRTREKTRGALGFHARSPDPETRGYSDAPARHSR